MVTGVGASGTERRKVSGLPTKTSTPGENWGPTGYQGDPHGTTVVSETHKSAAHRPEEAMNMFTGSAVVGTVV
jgi:hypothetical protein